MTSSLVLRLFYLVAWLYLGRISSLIWAKVRAKMFPKSSSVDKQDVALAVLWGPTLGIVLGIMLLLVLIAKDIVRAIRRIKSAIDLHRKRRRLFRMYNNPGVVLFLIGAMAMSSLTLVSCSKAPPTNTKEVAEQRLVQLQNAKTGDLVKLSYDSRLFSVAFDMAPTSREINLVCYLCGDSQHYEMKRLSWEVTDYWQYGTEEWLDKVPDYFK